MIEGKVVGVGEMCIRDRDSSVEKYWYLLSFGMNLESIPLSNGKRKKPVSYTHLDVYKRQVSALHDMWSTKVRKLSMALSVN